MRLPLTPPVTLCAAATTAVALACLVSSSSLVVTASAAAAAATAPSSSVEEDRKDAGDGGVGTTCGLYLAPSSQDATKWGVWLGEDVKEGSRLGGYSHVAINLHDFRANNNVDGNDDVEHSEFLSLIAFFIADNLWAPENGGAAHEFEEDMVLGEGQTHSGLFLTGPGILARYDSRITNVDFDVLEGYKRASQARDAGVAHPNRGAISPFDNVVFRVTEDSDAGSEIFLNYDYTGEAKDDVQHLNLLKEDYDKIDETIAEMQNFFDKHDANLDAEARKQIYRFLTEDFLYAAVGEKAPKIAQLFPGTPDDLHLVKKAGGIKKYNQARSSRVRNLDWLQNNGLCMDNIRPGISTIPNAGKGAFATRIIPKGGLVAPTPLIHIPDKASLNLYDLYLAEDMTLAREEDGEPIGTQLLMNYVYSHPETSMAFIPGGMHVGLINHSDKPNAKLQWSSHPNNKINSWSQLSPGEIFQDGEHYTVGLMMEVVALRDIEESEEVTIDYGKEWSEAWKEHKESWEEKHKLADEKEWPIRAADMNQQHKTSYFKTEQEQEDEPYPPDVAVKAFIFVSQDDSRGSRQNPYVWMEPKDGTQYHVDHLYDVRVLERQGAEAVGESGVAATATPYTYTVSITEESDHDDSGIVSYVKNVPHEVLLFVDDAGTSDQFAVDEPFRHYIGIPDDIFPEGAWRDLVEDEDE